MFIFDAHLDLAMNAMEWNRDLRLSVSSINEREKGLSDKPDREKATVSLPALRKGNIGLVVATQIARFVDRNNPLPGWHSPEQAWAQTQSQLAWYQAMEADGEMRLIRNLKELNIHLDQWNDGTANDHKPIGFILSLEGADSLITVQHLEKAFQYGLRALGPAHYGPGRYANGTDSQGEMGKPGLDLLKEMERLGIILDATHLCDDAFWQAMDHFHGAVWASHNNCRSLVPHNRQFSDEQLKILIERKAVIGAAFDAWMLVSDWVRGKSTPEGSKCDLTKVIDHIDHICQLAGNSLHVGIGSDLDGAFGREQCPSDITSISDLQKLVLLLKQRGYDDTDVNNIMNNNWLRFLRNTWK